MTGEDVKTAVVPTIPTDEMVVNAMSKITGGSTFDAEERQEIARDVWSAMLAAAPAVSAEDVARDIAIVEGVRARCTREARFDQTGAYRHLRGEEAKSIARILALLPPLDNRGAGE